MNSTIYLGLAGWQIRTDQASLFPAEGSHLERYAAQFNAVEINSSFKSDHQRKTYERWAATVPDEFRFSVKCPKKITHELRFKNCESELKLFINCASGLEKKLAVILVQLPPSFAFDLTVAKSFFCHLRQLYSGTVAFEPRHKTWFGTDIEKLIEEFDLSRVAADPPAQGTQPVLSEESLYYRLHGSPRMYYSAYSQEFISSLSQILRSGSRWCIFDNTAAGCATGNALELKSQLCSPTLP